jgi:hypothetical protein
MARSKSSIFSRFISPPLRDAPSLSLKCHRYPPYPVSVQAESQPDFKRLPVGSAFPSPPPNTLYATRVTTSLLPGRWDGLKHFWLLSDCRESRDRRTPTPRLSLSAPVLRFLEPAETVQVSFRLHFAIWSVAKIFSRCSSTKRRLFQCLLSQASLNRWITQSDHRWRWDCQPYASAALYPQENSWYSHLLEAESTNAVSKCGWNDQFYCKNQLLYREWTHNHPACITVPKSNCATAGPYWILWIVISRHWELAHQQSLHSSIHTTIHEKRLSSLHDLPVKYGLQHPSAIFANGAAI